MSEAIYRKYCFNLEGGKFMNLNIYVKGCYLAFVSVFISLSMCSVVFARQSRPPVENSWESSKGSGDEVTLDAYIVRGKQASFNEYKANRAVAEWISISFQCQGNFLAKISAFTGPNDWSEPHTIVFPDGEGFRLEKKNQILSSLGFPVDFSGNKAEKNRNFYPFYFGFSKKVLENHEMVVGGVTVIYNDSKGAFSRLSAKCLNEYKSLGTFR